MSGSTTPSKNCQVFFGGVLARKAFPEKYYLTQFPEKCRVAYKITFFKLQFAILLFK
jgi:hypothetical protein